VQEERNKGTLGGIGLTIPYLFCNEVFSRT
jgi:hypothetical protein